MALNCFKENDIAIVEASGNLDAEGASAMETQVLDLLNNREQKILFDFSNLDYINSSGLRVLVLSYQKLKKDSGSMAICGIRDYIQEIFEISGYDKIFPIFQSRTEALDTM